jgi:hypothetical protein
MMGKKREKEIKKNPGKSRTLWAGGAVALFAGGFLLWGWLSVVEPGPLAKSESHAASGYVRREKRSPLSPALFVGQTARAYQVAQEIPDILDQLYCYCECDKHLGHVSLLSCFTDKHGAT